jgi:polar amino acid transport system substrate-binding protein
VTLACALAAGCGRGDDGDALDRVRAAGELVWAADLQGGSPYVFEDPAAPDVVRGFEVDLMEALARELGVKARMVQYSWSSLVPALERGDFDVALNGLEATPERAERVRLSAPYYTYAEILAVREDTPWRSLADLTGRRVATLNQTMAWDLLRANPVEVRTYEGVEEPYADLQLGRVDAVLLDDIVADTYGCNKDGIHCVPEPVALGTYVAAFRKADSPLADAFDAALARLEARGEREAILRRWNLWNAHQTRPPPPPPTPSAAPPEFDEVQLTRFAEAALVTLAVSTLAFALAMALGALLAAARLFGATPVRAAARVYVELFRGTPVLLQLYLLYFGLAPWLNLDPFVAAVLGLGLNYAAYEAEIYRGAIAAIPRGQREAAEALGLGTWHILRHILAPQAFRAALPSITNDFISILKDSSLISAITVIELTKRMTIAAVDLRSWLLPGLACAAFYLALSLPLAVLSRRLERRLARDSRQRPAQALR